MSNDRGAARLSPTQRREQIAEVAAAHFSRDGVAAASMSAIARDAKVTRALVYHYFPGKESLLSAVLAREANRVLLATEPDPSLSQRENLERALSAYFDHFTASSGGVRELYVPSLAATASTAAELANANHIVQVDRLLAATGTTDTAESRLALGAWLAFVEHTARHATESSELSCDGLLTLCITVLESVLDHPLPTT